ncbi:hypothetical protein HYDPIDRAFT_26682 [Hydnomerulius pinastri MD-312]|nr:hypothetical protein HYDPIDRAFT_26682 [Hydnomerulius pinastri MD-312]
MSSARGWFTKRVHPPGPKSPKDLTHSISTEKLPLHADGSKSPGTFKFNTFASVMGKKPKKSHPTLAIQDPTSPINPPNGPGADRSTTPRYTNRPPAKSISSTVRSGDESNEPRTPSDVAKDRISFPRSVMTLSDPDPFAAGAISVPQGIVDTNRLSVFSNSSGNDGLSKKSESVLPFRRTSFASTSSQSHSGSFSAEAKSFHAADVRKVSMRPLPEQIDTGYGRDEEDSLSSGWDCIPRPTLSKSGSAVTLTDKKPPETPASSRPPSRPRGYTESSRSTPTVSHLPRKGSTPPNGELPSLSPFPQGIASSLSRKMSASRLASEPPSAPPLHDLPAPPVSRTSSEDPEGDAVSPSGSGSSSSISFASSSSSTKDVDDSYFNPRYRTLKEKHQVSDREQPKTRRPHHPKEPAHNSLADIFGQASSSSARPLTASSTHSLKKSMSHSTLQKAKIGSGLTPPPPLSSDSKHGQKELKTQRSFHQSRLQTPPVPHLRHANSYTPVPAPSSSDTNLPTELRRPATASAPVTVRRRLFSGSSNQRPSTGTTEDDLRSVFSLPTDAERSQGATSLHAASLFDEGDSESIPSGVVAPDYAQQIMSPAEMLKVEAVVQSEFESKYGETLRNRHRNISLTSASTPFPGATYVKEGLSTAPTSFPRLSVRTLSNASGSSATLPRSLARPSTAQDTSHSSLSSPLSASPVSHTVGLPLPPRSRSRPQTAETTYYDLASRRSSNVPFNPLTPPPRRRSNRTSLNGDKAPHKSMMRKPSFLEIADEAPSYDGSFLDFDSGRESLDIPRGDEDFGGATVDL